MEVTKKKLVLHAINTFVFLRVLIFHTPNVVLDILKVLFSSDYHSGGLVKVTMVTQTTVPVPGPGPVDDKLCNEQFILETTIQHVLITMGEV